MTGILGYVGKAVQKGSHVLKKGLLSSYKADYDSAREQLSTLHTQRDSQDFNLEDAISAAHTLSQYPGEDVASTLYDCVEAYHNTQLQSIERQNPDSWKYEAEQIIEEVQEQTKFEERNMKPLRVQQQRQFSQIVCDYAQQQLKAHAEQAFYVRADLDSSTYAKKACDIAEEVSAHYDVVVDTEALELEAYKTHQELLKTEVKRALVQRNVDDAYALIDWHESTIVPQLQQVSEGYRNLLNDWNTAKDKMLYTAAWYAIDDANNAVGMPIAVNVARPQSQFLFSQQFNSMLLHDRAKAFLAMAADFIEKDVIENLGLFAQPQYKAAYPSHFRHAKIPQGVNGAYKDTAFVVENPELLNIVADAQQYWKWVKTVKEILPKGHPALQEEALAFEPDPLVYINAAQGLANNIMCSTLHNRNGIARFSPSLNGGISLKNIRRSVHRFMPELEDANIGIENLVAAAEIHVGEQFSAQTQRIYDQRTTEIMNMLTNYCKTRLLPKKQTRFPLVKKISRRCSPLLRKRFIRRHPK